MVTSRSPAPPLSSSPPKAPAAGRRRASVPPLDPSRHAPSAAHPLRANLRRFAADTHVQPHAHPWAQIALSATGVIRLNTRRSTYLVPPSRAVWVPPQEEHHLSVVEDAEVRVLYVHQDEHLMGPGVAPEQAAAWRVCRVLEVSDLLRELVAHLPDHPLDLQGDPADQDRQRHLCALVLDELRRAPPIPLGVALPQDKRLLALCEAVLENPAGAADLPEWARRTGASPRTIARLFRSELGTTFGQWRQQVMLAKAVTLAAQNKPMRVIASELGYQSASAFTAMVTRCVGSPPRRFFASKDPSRT
jgi:AraC-like DNA-binding protein/quercetin dioxygenase-like cupin family protein